MAKLVYVGLISTRSVSIFWKVYMFVLRGLISAKSFTIFSTLTKVV